MIRHNFFKTSFFLSVISEWNKFDVEIRNSASLDILKDIYSVLSEQSPIMSLK